MDPSQKLLVDEIDKLFAERFDRLFAVLDRHPRAAGEQRDASDESRIGTPLPLPAVTPTPTPSSAVVREASRFLLDTDGSKLDSEDDPPVQNRVSVDAFLFSAGEDEIPNNLDPANSSADVAAVSLHALDRLSLLPDVVLRNIVSRLPVKDAARTVVLSRRWRPLWRAPPFASLVRSNQFGRLFELGASWLMEHPGMPPTLPSRCSTLGGNHVQSAPEEKQFVHVCLADTGCARARLGCARLRRLLRGYGALRPRVRPRRARLRHRRKSGAPQLRAPRYLAAPLQTNMRAYTPDDNSGDLAVDLRSGCRIMLPVGSYPRGFGVEWLSTGDVHCLERGALEAENRGWICAVLNSTTSSPPALLQASSTYTIDMELALGATGPAATPSDFSVAPRPVDHGAPANCSTKCSGGAVEVVAPAAASTVAMTPVVISTSAADKPTAIDVVGSIVTFDVNFGGAVSASVTIAGMPEVLPVSMKVLDGELLKCGGEFFKLCACNSIVVPVVLGRSCDVILVPDMPPKLMGVLGCESIDSAKLCIQQFKDLVVMKKWLVLDGQELSRNNYPVKDYGLAEGNILHPIIRLSDLCAIDIETATGGKFQFQLELLSDGVQLRPTPWPSFTYLTTWCSTCSVQECLMQLLICGDDFFKLYPRNLIDVPVVLGRICDVVVVQLELFPSSDWLEQQPWPPPNDLRFWSSDAESWPIPWPSFSAFHEITAGWCFILIMQRLTCWNSRGHCEVLIQLKAWAARHSHQVGLSLGVALLCSSPAQVLSGIFLVKAKRFVENVMAMVWRIISSLATQRKAEGILNYMEALLNNNLISGIRCVPATALLEFLTCTMVISVSIVACVLILKLTQRKCGGNALHCSILAQSTGWTLLYFQLATDELCYCMIQAGGLWTHNLPWDPGGSDLAIGIVQWQYSVLANFYHTSCPRRATAKNGSLHRAAWGQAAF